jgi:DNA-binding transcriptional ArsR family regulator
MSHGSWGRVQPWGQVIYHRYMTMTARADARTTAVVDAEPTPPPDLDSLAPAASLFRSLGDPSRLAILGHLVLGEHKVRELTDHLGLAQSTVSAHLRCLLDCGLVHVRAVGRSSMYSLAVEGEVLGVLGAAEALLAATGDAVLLCPRYGKDAPR